MIQSDLSSSPIKTENPQQTPRRFYRLMLLSGVVGCYGVGFGAFLMFAGMYLGPPVLIPAIAHVLFGFAFLASAAGINANKEGARWSVMVLSMMVVFVAVLAILAYCSSK